MVWLWVAIAWLYLAGGMAVVMLVLESGMTITRRRWLLPLWPILIPASLLVALWERD